MLLFWIIVEVELVGSSSNLVVAFAVGGLIDFIDVGVETQLVSCGVLVAVGDIVVVTLLANKLLIKDEEELVVVVVVIVVDDGADNDVVVVDMKEEFCCSNWGCCCCCWDDDDVVVILFKVVFDVICEFISLIVEICAFGVWDITTLPITFWVCCGGWG